MSFDALLIVPNPKPVPCCPWQRDTFPDYPAGKVIPDHLGVGGVGQVVRVLIQILSRCTDVARELIHGRWHSEVKAMPDDSLFLAGDQAVTIGRPLKNLPKSCEWIMWPSDSAQFINRSDAQVATHTMTSSGAGCPRKPCGLALAP